MRTSQAFVGGKDQKGKVQGRGGGGMDEEKRVLIVLVCEVGTLQQQGSPGR